MGRQTNTARRTRQENVRQRAATARAAAQRRQQRQRIWIIVVSTVAVLAVIGTFVAVGVLSSSPKSSEKRTAATPAVLGGVTGVPPGTLNTVGTGGSSSPPTSIHDGALTSGGKPEVLFIGAEFCPYCAAERWAIVQSLSRFGTFSGLKTIHSSASDVYPNTATFTFYGASYTSPTIVFRSVEDETVTKAPLETPTAAENALWQKYTGNPPGFPFLDIGGQYVTHTPSFDPGLLKGLTAEQISAQLADPSSAVAKAIDGAANVLTAAICKTTNGQPASVCSASGVTAAATALGG